MLETWRSHLHRDTIKSKWEKWNVKYAPQFCSQIWFKTDTILMWFKYIATPSSLVTYPSIKTENREAASSAWSTTMLNLIFLVVVLRVVYWSIGNSGPKDSNSCLKTQENAEECHLCCCSSLSSKKLQSCKAKYTLRGSGSTVCFCQ